MQWADFAPVLKVSLVVANQVADKSLDPRQNVLGAISGERQSSTGSASSSSGGSSGSGGGLTDTGGEGGLRSGDSRRSLDGNRDGSGSDLGGRGGGGLGGSNAGAGSNAGSGADGRAGGAGAARAARARSRSTEGEIDTRLVGLVNGLGVPVPLEHTVTGGVTLAAEVVGDGDLEAGLVGGDTGGGGGIDIPRDQGLANDTVGGGIDHGDVGNTSVGGTDVDLEVDSLAGSVGLDVVLVVGELVTLAKPDITLIGVVVALARGDLQLALNVTVVVGLLVDLDLLSAGSLHGATGHTGLGAGDEAMGVDQGDNAGKSQSGGELLHFCWKLVRERMELIDKPVPTKDCIVNEWSSARFQTGEVKNECRIRIKFKKDWPACSTGLV